MEHMSVAPKLSPMSYIDPALFNPPSALFLGFEMPRKTAIEWLARSRNLKVEQLSKSERQSRYWFGSIWLLKVHTLCTLTTTAAECILWGVEKSEYKFKIVPQCTLRRGGWTFKLTYFTYLYHVNVIKAIHNIEFVRMVTLSYYVLNLFTWTWVIRVIWLEELNPFSVQRDATRRAHVHIS